MGSETKMAIVVKFPGTAECNTALKIPKELAGVANTKTITKQETDGILILKDQDQIVKMYNDAKQLQNSPILLSSTLELIFKYLKNELFAKRIPIDNELYDLIVKDDLATGIKIKHAREINDKIFKDFSEVKNFKFYSEDENILKELSFILFSFGAGKNFYLTKDNLIDNIPRIIEFLGSKLNNKIDVDEFCVIIDTIGKFIPGLNRQVSVKCRIPASNIYNFLISIKDKYIKLIMEEDNLKEKVKKVYEVIDKIDFLYEKSTVNMKLNLSLMLADQILSKIDDGIIITDKSNKISSFNDGLSRMFDIPIDDIKNILNEKKWPFFGLKKLSHKEYEFANCGETKTLLFDKKPLDKQILGNSYSMLRLIDITEKKKFEEDRRAMLDSSPDGIFMITIVRKTNGSMEYRSERHRGSMRTFTDNENEIIEKSIEGEEGIIVSNKIKKLAALSLETNTQKSIEYKLKDGKHIRLTICPYSNNKLILWRSDITEIKNAESAKIEEEKAKIGAENANNLTKLITKIIQMVIETYDKYSQKHSENVGKITQKIVEVLNKTETTNISSQEAYLAGAFHDIGKLTIPKETLNKPIKLDPEEFELIKIHSRKGLNFFNQVFDLNLSLDGFDLRILRAGAGYHHERLDGSGYPEKLKDDEIPLISKIIAVADVIDAMSADRGYRVGKATPGLDEAIEQIKRDRGTLLDAKIVDIVVGLYEDFLEKTKNGEKDELFSYLNYKMEKKDCDEVLESQIVGVVVDIYKDSLEKKNNESFSSMKEKIGENEELLNYLDYKVGKK